MANRRDFIKTAAIGSVAMALNSFKSNEDEIPFFDGKVNKPIVISTWNFGVKANGAAWEILKNNGRALDAVEAGVKIPEGDPTERSVGYGGRPDRDGRVTLDACIMDENANIGSVACLEHIKHPISVARAVMEKTPHVMLVGDGALQFALSQGFQKENLLVEDSEKEWKEWLKTSHYKPIANIENHDTIGMIALDSSGNLSGACTTSGMAFKMHGRVGDSPIIGAGLYVDNEIGAATATGHGEEVIRISGCHLVVELMRQGKSPQKACEEAVSRIVKLTKNRGKNLKDIQVGFIALNKKGEYGSYCIQGGFNYAVNQTSGNKLVDADYFLK
ncbi:isoaspartyl peptidase/L-asparaginase family protein [Flavobacterium aquatile]|uniref:Glycosylasparaginase n=1 Tax=Flavobacterium aquatile LMG 4008 = ATCC 11947 TaxID=1453498 RepID=A0A095SXV1_9FLAO|nr:N(4)-(beta-N-acetylglucosaminyl)-L-asparaginase [Flavobacterium aquatile]KGD69402.1 glycosylasparaginase [Flavobacterium aquatile LMG 4008 = ATCC 11947]OXA66143.1 glycosylasparaginase [Flavobacterium aquatile] [Flavobacterium aquatile LMG 4008 = ATCC 11947]GEC77630.1 asparaginase [Flavobacterium aquatile]